jgi:hypothetical protein
MPLTTVYISGPRGQYAVDAVSSHDAVRKAVAFFHDPFWKGPKPKAGTGAAGVSDGRQGNMGTGFRVETDTPRYIPGLNTRRKPLGYSQ